METDSDENKYADPSSVEFRLWMAQQKRKKRKESEPEPDPEPEEGGD